MGHWFTFQDEDGHEECMNTYADELRALSPYQERFANLLYPYYLRQPELFQMLTSSITNQEQSLPFKKDMQKPTFQIILNSTGSFLAIENEIYVHLEYLHNHIMRTGWLYERLLVALYCSDTKFRIEAETLRAILATGNGVLESRWKTHMHAFTGTVHIYDEYTKNAEEKTITLDQWPLFPVKDDLFEKLKNYD